MSNHGGNSAAIPDIGNGILSYSAVQFDPISANTLEEVDQNAAAFFSGWIERLWGTLDAISSYFQNVAFRGWRRSTGCKLELPSIPFRSKKFAPNAKNFRCGESSIHGSARGWLRH
ncbi:MAG: hypothetical protein ACLR23_02765 [Clostridia bacterium]